MLLEKYKAFLPINNKTPKITIGEGNTPLIKSRNIGPSLGIKNLYFKLEGTNPTGSFKDRGMVMCIANAIEEKASAIICASTGNTSASAAAFGSYFNLKTVIMVPKKGIAAGKLAQASLYGAKILAINDNFDKALSLAINLSKTTPITLVNSINHFRIEGQKTASFEIIDCLKNLDMVSIPVGNAGNITAYWKGFKEYFKASKTSNLPQMHGFQAKNPQTIASAIRIKTPASWQGALNASQESNGSLSKVSDDKILQAYRLLAKEEGIFCEPASAASIAGILNMSKQINLKNKTIVCIITGSGLKDPDTALNNTNNKPIDLEASHENLAEILQNIHEIIK